MTIVPSQRWVGDTIYTAKLVFSVHSIPTLFDAYKADVDDPRTTNLNERITFSIDPIQIPGSGVPTIIRIDSSQKEAWMSTVPANTIEIPNSEAFLVNGVYKGASQQQVKRGIITPETWYIVGRLVEETGDLQNALDLSPPIVQGESFQNRYKPVLFGKNFSPKGYPNNRPNFQVEFRFPNGVTKRAEILNFDGKASEERSPLEPEITVDNLEYWKNYDIGGFTSRALDPFEENFYKTQKWSDVTRGSDISDGLSPLNELIDEFFMVSIVDGKRTYVYRLEKTISSWTRNVPWKAKIYKRPDGSLFYFNNSLSKDQDELNLLS